MYDHKAYSEKSLGRMIKAKAKADRAAARHAQQAQLHALGVSTPSSSTTATPGPASETATPTPADSPHEADEPTPSTKESPDRTEMLRGKPDVVDRFMRLTVPILVDVYAASVITTVRIKTLTGLLKAISYLDADGIKRVLTVSRNFTTFFMQGLTDEYIFPSLYPSLALRHLSCHPRTTRPSLSALCNSSSFSFPSVPKSTGQPFVERVYSTKSGCLPNAR